MGSGAASEPTHSGSVQKSQHPLPPALEGQWGQHVVSLLDIQALRKAGGGRGEGWQWPSGSEPPGRWELSRQEWTKPQATSAPDPPPQDLAAGRRGRGQKRGPGPLVHEQRSVLPRGPCGASAPPSPSPGAPGVTSEVRAPWRLQPRPELSPGARPSPSRPAPARARQRRSAPGSPGVPRIQGTAEGCSRRHRPGPLWTGHGCAARRSSSGPRRAPG